MTYCDHNRVPGGREDIRVVVPLVMLLQLLGEKLSGQLKSQTGGNVKAIASTFPKHFPNLPSVNAGGLAFGFGLGSQRRNM